MIADVVRPSLTTIAQSTEKLGSLAVNLVKSPSSTHEDVVVPVTLIERETVRDMNRR